MDKEKWRRPFRCYNGQLRRGRSLRISRTAHLGPVRQPVWEKNVGLYRDDGLAAFEDISGPLAERIKKDITKFFTNLGLKITIKTNLRIVDFLDVTLSLSNGTYSPFRKPNDHPLYINTKSNHPPTITKLLPAAISRRVSEISCNKEVFEKAKPDYQQALRASGYVPAQLDSLARFDPRQIGPGLIWRGSKRANESQYGLDHKTIQHNEFYDSMSLSYILLCNSLALSGIQATFGMEGPWHNRHQPTTLLLW